MRSQFGKPDLAHAYYAMWLARSSYVHSELGVPEQTGATGATKRHAIFQLGDASLRTDRTVSADLTQ